MVCPLRGEPGQLRLNMLLFHACVAKNNGRVGAKSGAERDGVLAGGRQLTAIRCLFWHPVVLTGLTG